MTPSDEATLTAKANPEGTADNSDDRQYTVENPVASTTHTIALFPAANVTVASDGTVTFKDADSNNVADDIGNVDAWITVVNGAAVPNDTQMTTVMPSAGSITFTVDGDTAESVIPVVFADADSDGQLDLTAPSTANADPKAPSESFGIGGEIMYQPPEATTFQDVAAGTVVDVNTTDGYYTLNTGGTAAPDVLVKYQTGDTFTYTSGGLNTPITMTQFETYLSKGDTVDPGAYNPGSTNHNITDDIPNAPTNVAANFRSTTNDVRVTWTKVANPDVQDYQVERATVTNGTVGTYAVVGTVAGNATAQYDDATVTGGNTYSYRVKARNSTPTAGPASDAVQVTIPAAADTTAPTVSGIVTSDNNTDGILDSGDQIAVSFSEKVTLASDASFTFRDADGSVGTISRGGNATMNLNSAGTTVFISLTGAPVPDQAGTTLGLDANAANETVTNSSGVADVAGNELAEVTATAADDGTVNDAVFTITFDEPMNEASLTAADIIVPTGSSVNSITWNGTSTVATVTLDTNLATNDVAGLKKQSVTDADGGNGPATDETFPSA